MNKKGFMGMALVDAASAILIVLIIAGFSILFSLSGLFTSQSTRLLQDEMRLEANTLMIGWLRYNVEGESMVEYILLNIDNTGMIESKTKEILEKACNWDSQCYWEVEILRRGEAYNIKGIGDPGDFNVKGSAEFLLPKKDEKIVLRLVKYGNPKEYFR